MALSELPALQAWGLSEDSRSLTLRFDGGDHQYSADQVETLMLILAFARAKMQPSVPSEIAQLQPDRVMCADAWQLKVDPDRSCLHVWMQHAGFGWGHAAIPALEAAGLGQELLDLAKTAPPQPSNPLQ